MSSDLVVAITGASGSPYGVRLVEVLLRAGRTVHLVVSPAAVEVFDREVGRTLRLDEGEFDPRVLLGDAAEGLDLAVTPLAPDGEVESVVGIAFWEGPVVVEGTHRGRRVRGTGMGEHFPVPSSRPHRRPPHDQRLQRSTTPSKNASP